MRKLSNLIIVVFVFIFVPKIVNAECTYADQNRLSSLANQVKASYEIMKDTSNLMINIDAISEDLYIVVKNNYDTSLEKVYYYTDTTNGKASFNNLDTNNVIEYKIDIYGNLPLCSTDKIRTVNLIVPMNNPYRNQTVCEQAKDYYLCQDYWNVNHKLSESEFQNKVQTYINNLNKKEQTPIEIPEKEPSLLDNILDFIIDYWYFLIIWGSIITITIIMIIIIDKKRRII